MVSVIVFRAGSKFNGLINRFIFSLANPELLKISPATFFLLSDDLFKVHKFKPNLKWRQAFEMYLKTMPPYYLLVNNHSAFSGVAFVG